ncbi:MAG: substrate-binding domain-containing protein [Desulfamplus sp.]|nr:substrate-binding domain-containing protein [Desulfamplus sp.]
MGKIKEINSKIVLMALVVSLIITVSFGNAQASENKKSLMMATTTSTDDTGLLDYLMPLFTKDTGIEIKWTATGTGKALALGVSCDVDVLLVHAPDAEKKYIEAGSGKDRKEVMYNDFIIIGPADDPAGVKGKSVVEALNTIREKQIAFASRGDDSGTHKKELELWKSSQKAIPEKESWYIQTGQGMLATINICEERKAYTMTDRGTYIKYKAQKNGNPQLHIIVEKDGILLNQYSVIAVNPEKCPKAKYELAKQFSDWMASQKGQNLINDFKLMGESLFTPNAK